MQNVLWLLFRQPSVSVWSLGACNFASIALSTSMRHDAHHQIDTQESVSRSRRMCLRIRNATRTMFERGEKTPTPKISALLRNPARCVVRPISSLLRTENGLTTDIFVVQYTGRGLVVKRPGVLSKVQMLTLVLGVGVSSLLAKMPTKTGVGGQLFCLHAVEFPSVLTKKTSKLTSSELLAAVTDLRLRVRWLSANLCDSS